MILTPQQRLDYLNTHIPYRLNSLMAWDLFISRRSESYDLEKEGGKCYWQSEFLEPAFEISIVFARSLIQFLGLHLKSNSLEYFVSKIDEDVQIWDVIPGKQPYPLNSIEITNQQHLCNIIKVANKASAHMTTKYSSTEEFESLIKGRKILFNMICKYVEGLNKTNLWWTSEQV